MNNEQILRKAIEKAFGSCTEEYAKSQIDRDDGYRVIFYHQFAKAFWGEEQIKRESDLSKLIAYCFWHITHYLGVQSQEGRQQKFDDLHGMNFEDVPAWQYHLQQIVLEEEPLKYLEKFLEEKFLEEK